MDSDNSFPEKPDFGRTWKKNLTMVWIAQFFSQIGFAFGLPFAPFYMQEMGVTRGNIDFWVALFGAGTPLTMMLFAPVWGRLPINTDGVKCFCALISAACLSSA